MSAVWETLTNLVLFWTNVIFKLWSYCLSSFDLVLKQTKNFNGKENVTYHSQRSKGPSSTIQRHYQLEIKFSSLIKASQRRIWCADTLQTMTLSFSHINGLGQFEEPKRLHIIYKCQNSVKFKNAQTHRKFLWTLYLRISWCQL